MDMERIIPSEISQRNTNTVWCHLYGESTKKSNTKKKVEWWLSGAGGGEKWRDVLMGTNFQL